MTLASDAEPPRGYNTPIPDAILTPASVETRIGTLEFIDGVPTPSTTEKVYNHAEPIPTGTHQFTGRIGWVQIDLAWMTTTT